MDVLRILITVFLCLAALVVIVTVLLQQGNRQGLGAISGGAETFFGKNKAKSYEGKLALGTKIGAAVFIVLSLVLAALSSVA
ncbi:preprotein translocase subunit SecG [Eubacteriales bacterium OttesenSCG-928-A19]|nr:preprotein translocase subunit SecG [Eubacteriales bacterium OttesenSCG-928-A19]